MMEIEFSIEATHVLMFARALGDPNPVYADAACSALGRSSRASASRP
jgi:hypothetical protein